MSVERTFRFWTHGTLPRANTSRANPMTASLSEKLRARATGICLYGLAPPKQSIAPEQLEAVVAQQLTRLRSLPMDGIVVYDIQDEGARIAAPRPFPFLPTLDPEIYANHHLGSLPV